MDSKRKELTKLRFEGPRFESPGLDVDMLTEIVAYKKLLVETAKAVWRNRNPGRERLPKGFDDSLCIKMAGLEAGSVVVPLVREFPQDGKQMDLPLQPDEIDEAVSLIVDAIDAAAEDRQLPETFPKNVIPLFSDFGRSLMENESISMNAPTRETPVRYTRNICERLTSWREQTYEDDVDFTGEVRLADLDGCKFSIRADNDEKIEGRFSPDQERLVTDALRDHESRRLRIRGKAEFSRKDGSIKKITSIQYITPMSVGYTNFDPSARPIWEVVAEMVAEIPDEEWKRVPDDFARNHDHYLYGAPKRKL